MELTCQVARKEHKCDVCGQPIRIGTKYWRKYDPEAMKVEKEHSNCLETETGGEVL